MGLSLVPSLRFGFEFFGFHNSKMFSSLSFLGLRKLAQNSLSFRVCGFERKFRPKFGQNASFFWQNFLNFRKIAETRRVFEFGETQSSSRKHSVLTFFFSLGQFSVSL